MDAQLSPDSAFGSAELDGAAASTSAAPSVSAPPSLLLAPLGSRVLRAAAVHLQPFTPRQKSAWLSGGGGRGFVRFYDAACHLRASLVFPCTLSTTALDVCARLGVPSNLLYVETGGWSLHRLEPTERPLRLQNDFLAQIGADASECAQLGDLLSLGYLIRFYCGAPSVSPELAEPTLSASCKVRFGKAAFNQWTARICVLNGARIVIYPESGSAPSSTPTIVSLCRAKVREAHSKSHKRCIKVATSGKPRATLYFAFESLLDTNVWLSRCLRASDRVAPMSDLSGKQLELLPSQLFSVNSVRLITHLNLKHNILRQRSDRANPYLCGWLDDLAALQSLRDLSLSDNKLTLFPRCLAQLLALTTVDLSLNLIDQLPDEICQLKCLRTLKLQGNRLTQLPPSLSSCKLLNLDLSFNWFRVIPPVLYRMRTLTHWQLAGNQIDQFDYGKVSDSVEAVCSIDLRRNQLRLFPPVTVGSMVNVTEVDVSYNCGLFELDFRSLNSLKSLNCERMDLEALQVNGTNLQNLTAGHNRMKSITVMPVPLKLRSFNVSHNHMTSLPVWTTQLEQIQSIFADHNRLTDLPKRLFCSLPSLRILDLNHNILHALPEQVENCSIETLNLHHNQIEALPTELLSSAHRLRVLNASQNFLKLLPPPNAFEDLNKVQHLCLAANRLYDDVFFQICRYRRLKTLNLACNRLRYLDSRCIERLTCLEELNLSANRIVHLPESLADLPRLRVFRAHSNCLTQLPDFTQSDNLKVLDVTNNQLLNEPTVNLLAQTMRRADVNGTVESTAATKSGGQVLVGSGSELPSVETSESMSWSVGRAECAGDRNKLCVRQMSQKLQRGELFCVIDGGLNDEITNELCASVPLFVESAAAASGGAVTEATAATALLNAHLQLGESGQQVGASCALCCLSRRLPSTADGGAASYKLHVANVGHAQAVLCRGGKAVLLTRNFSLDEHRGLHDELERVRAAGQLVTNVRRASVSARAQPATLQTNAIGATTSCSRLLGCSFLFPAVLPKPHSLSVSLGDDDEFIIVASRGLWSVMSCSEAVRRIRPAADATLAAKHLQDMAQAYGWSGNLAIAVVRFTRAAPSPPPPPPARPLSAARRLHSRSAANVARPMSAASTDSDARSEPSGRTPRLAEPNYYFDYKRRLKEMQQEEQSDEEAAVPAEADYETLPLPSLDDVSLVAADRPFGAEASSVAGAAVLAARAFGWHDSNASTLTRAKAAPHLVWPVERPSAPSDAPTDRRQRFELLREQLAERLRVLQNGQLIKGCDEAC